MALATPGEYFFYINPSFVVIAIVTSLSGSEQFKTQVLRQGSLRKLIHRRHLWKLPVSGMTQMLQLTVWQ